MFSIVKCLVFSALLAGLLAGCAHGPRLTASAREYEYGHDDRPYTAVPKYLSAATTPAPSVCDKCPPPIGQDAGHATQDEARAAGGTTTF